jgi:hypothetical protein
MRLLQRALEMNDNAASALDALSPTEVAAATHVDHAVLWDRYASYHRALSQVFTAERETFARDVRAWMKRRESEEES